MLTNGYTTSILAPRVNFHRVSSNRSCFKAAQNDTSQTSCSPFSTFCRIVIKAHRWPEDTGILPGGAHSGGEGVGVLGFITRSSQAPAPPAGARGSPYGSQAWLRTARAHMYGKHKVWRGKSQGVTLVREAARGPGAG